MELLQQAGYPYKDIPSQGGRERRGWTTGQGPFVLLCLPTNARGRSASHPAKLCHLHLNSSPSPATEASRWDSGVPEYVCVVDPLEGNLFPGWGESRCSGGLPQAPLSSHQFIVQECIWDQGHRQPGNLVALPARKPVGSGNISKPQFLQR